MRSSRTFIVAGQLALLTLALASCGRQVVPEAPVGQVTPETTAVQPAPQPAQTAAAEIVSVRVLAGTTEADLLSRYPGARVLALHASEGYAQLLSSGTTAAAAPTMGSLSLNAQAVTVTATEPDITLATSVIDDSAVAQGNSVWASGNGVWASGNGVWASGTNTGGSISALAANAEAWSKLDLGNGQKQAPLLGQGIKVAVLDTGIDIAHPAFAGHLDVASGWDYVGSDATPQDEKAVSGSSAAYGHGTAVAGIILQVAPNATIIPYRVLGPDGSGRLSNIIMAVNDATKYGAKVINMSLGTTKASAALSAAIKSAINSGVMVVASSGNSGDSNISYPARYAPDMQLALGGGLISVGSISLGDKKSSFSTCGLSLDMLAPGEAVVTTFPNGQLTRATGTSFAAPMASGAVALAMSKGRTNVAALYKSMKASATAPTDPLFWSQMGSGTLNVGKLMVTP